MKKIKAGNCYQNSIKFIYQFDALGMDIGGFLLCHGIVTGTSGPVEGFEYGHSWLEINDVVLDVEQNITVLKGIYYLVGKIEYVKRYSIEMAKKALLENESYGPWDEKIIAVDDNARKALGEYYEFSK